MIKFIDNAYGREKLIELIGLTTATQMLNYLQTSEKDMISNWKESVELNEHVKH